MESKSTRRELLGLGLPALAGYAAWPRVGLSAEGARVRFATPFASFTQVSQGEGRGSNRPLLAGVPR